MAEVRCEAHVGEVYPPRCDECDKLQRAPQIGDNGRFDMTPAEISGAMVGLLTAARESPEFAGDYFTSLFPVSVPADWASAARSQNKMLGGFVQIMNDLRDQPQTGPLVEAVIDVLKREAADG